MSDCRDSVGALSGLCRDSLSVCRTGAQPHTHPPASPPATRVLSRSRSGIERARRSEMGGTSVCKPVDDNTSSRHECGHYAREGLSFQDFSTRHHHTRRRWQSSTRQSWPPGGSTSAKRRRRAGSLRHRSCDAIADPACSMHGTHRGRLSVWGQGLAVTHPASHARMLRAADRGADAAQRPCGLMHCHQPRS